MLSSDSQNINSLKSHGNKKVLSDPALWKQHTNKEGRFFWYHTLTGESTWEKPEELKSELEKAISIFTSWKEYTAANGRIFWFHKETKNSVWTCPEEITLLRKEMTCEWKPFTEKNEARDYLKILYKLKGITLRSRFEDALNLIKNDYRYNFFSSLTTGEKKQVFTEYQSKLQKLQREKERERKVEARKIFVDVLSKWPSLTRASLLSVFQADNTNQWWLNCLPLSEQEDLFNDYIDENMTTLVNKQKAQRQESKEKIFNFFVNHPSINIDMKWTDATDILLKDGSVLPADPRDILSAWELYIYETDKEEREAYQNKIRRASRLYRDAFRELIQREVESGTLHARVSFSSFIEMHKDHPAYVNLVGVPLATPREIFEDHTYPLIEAYEHEKNILKKTIRTNNIVVKHDTTLNAFMDSCLQAGTVEVHEISTINWELFFQSLMKRALRKNVNKKNKSSDLEQKSKHKHYSLDPNEKHYSSHRKRHKSRYHDNLTPNISEEEEEEEEDGALSNYEKDVSPKKGFKRSKWRYSTSPYNTKKIHILKSYDESKDT